MIWAWVTQNKFLVWVGGGLLALLALFLGWKKIEGDIKDAAKKAERAANAKRNAEEHARTLETSSQVKDEIHAQANVAREAAADLPEYASADELRNARPDLAAVVFGNREGHERGS